MSTARKYVLTKIAPGDYLLPSNDGRQLWRITRADAGTFTLEPEEAFGSPPWQVWRYAHAVSGPGASTAEEITEDLEGWDNWSLEASWCRSRAEAIAEAMRMGT